MVIDKCPITSVSVCEAPPLLNSKWLYQVEVAPTEDCGFESIMFWFGMDEDPFETLDFLNSGRVALTFWEFDPEDYDYHEETGPWTFVPLA